MDPDVNVLPRPASTVALTSGHVVMKTLGNVDMSRIRKRFQNM